MRMRLEVEIIPGIVVGDVLHDFPDEIHLACREFALLDVLTEDGAEDAAEVFVARIADKTA